MAAGSSPPLDLRSATEEDFEFAHQLTRGNMEAYVIRHFGGWNCDIFTDNYHRGRNYILWVSDARVGYVRLRSEPPILLLDDLQIAPSHQHCGFGSCILSHLDTLLPEFGCHTIRLRVYHENPARRLYLRSGFQEVERNEGTSYLHRTV
ncbi:MAG TPA: GNAT family N-acetyltransferase [Chthoniobacter sp.]|nr:GNAT family N-acetyltransferase [Chthoniobacter sp.]